jgi:predicted nucleic acid-binding protein
MKVFLDTSVLVAAVVQKHESHTRAFAVLERIQNGRDQGNVSAHSLAEMYAVLTKSPPPFRHSPEQALLSIEENVLRHFKLTALAATDYAEMIRDAAPARVMGGTIYDSLVLRCAAKANPDKIFTLNVKHFEATADGSIRPIISAP